MKILLSARQSFGFGGFASAYLLLNKSGRFYTPRFFKELKTGRMLCQYSFICRRLILKNSCTLQQIIVRPLAAAY